MRVLYARAGIPYSPFTGLPITSQTISQIVDKIKTLPKKSTIFLYAPVVRGRKGEYKKDILNYKKRGFRKIKVDNQLYEIDNAPVITQKIQSKVLELKKYFLAKKCFYCISYLYLIPEWKTGKIRILRIVSSR